MSQSPDPTAELIRAVCAGDRTAIIQGLARGVQGGACPRTLLLTSVLGVLQASRFELMGTKRTHGVLASLAAVELGARVAPELAWAAALNGLVLLAEGPASRKRAVAGEDAGPRRGWECLHAGDLLGADAWLRDGVVDEGRWLEACGRSLEGWGHRLIGGRMAWRAWQATGERGWLRSALRLWLPWTADPAQQAALEQARDLGFDTAPGGGQVDQHAVRGLAEAMLAGQGVRVTALALGAGVSAASAGRAVALAASRVLVEVPALHPVHALTVSHALLALVDTPGVDAGPALFGAIALVEDAWEARVRDGRLAPHWGRGALGERPVVSSRRVREALERACVSEALPVMGHGLKVSLAAVEIAEALPEREAPWANLALVRSAGTWPSLQRPWITLRTLAWSNSL